ncbi:MAG: DUF4062 domain-containing protein, partial [Thermoproteota archaeon]|nr:DUF4062 domain-containing protein [Thermoproteota archaeon]
MAQEKRLQVFVSSTYNDLKEERETTVEAILSAGHIPAGMELFAAGDEQMRVIRRWIDQSDVFMLLLGGRYGSIEPKSQKSYIHLKYEYAVRRRKPLFAVIIDEGYLEKKVRLFGTQVIEKDNPHKLHEFRRIVQNRVVSFWSDPRDIQVAIHRKLRELTLQENLTGWIRGDMARTVMSLQEQISSLRNMLTELESKNRQLEEELRLEQVEREVYWDTDLSSVHGLMLIYMAWLAIDRDVTLNLKELNDRLKWNDYRYSYGFLVALRTAKLIVFTSNFEDSWHFLYLHPALTNDFKNNLDRRIKQILEENGLPEGE